MSRNGRVAGKRALLLVSWFLFFSFCSKSHWGDPMKRHEFTAALGKLLVDMILKGERPLLDWVKRSPEEQARLFEQGLSKCDGVNKLSRHQRACAADILFLNEAGNGICEPIKGWGYWHDRWEQFGGKPMIGWDKGHFEG